jgi:hypothetical protein
MRNTLNGQIYAFNQPDFLCVSGTHGPAHLAPYDQPAWDKYQLAKIAGSNITSNTFIVVPTAASLDPADIQSTDGVFSPKGNNVVVLQRRGVVFLACHNAIWELASRLVAADQNPDHLSVDAVAADLTNHLIPNVVLTPGVCQPSLTSRKRASSTRGECRLHFDSKKEAIAHCEQNGLAYRVFEPNPPKRLTRATRTTSPTRAATCGRIESASIVSRPFPAAQTSTTL